MPWLEKETNISYVGNGAEYLVTPVSQEWNFLIQSLIKISEVLKNVNIVTLNV